MKRFFCVFVCGLLIVSMFATSLVANASEVENGNSEVGDSSNVVDPTDGLDVEENGTDNGGESSETSGGGDNSGSGEDVTHPSDFLSDPSDGSQNPVVDISEESIQAIADALSDDESMSFTDSAGNNFVLQLDSSATFSWSDFCNDFNDFKYKIVAYRSGRSFVFLADSAEMYVNSSGYIQGYEKLYHGSRIGSEFRLHSIDNYTPASITIIFANQHLFYPDGSIFYESSYIPPPPPPEYIVSFDTGFDDLVIDSQIHSSLDLPIPKYSGYGFAGWYLDSDFTILFDSSYEFTGDTTLFAKWIDEPDMAMFHSTIFDAFVKFFTYEPMIYVFALMGLICIIAVGKRLIASRY